MLSSLDLKEVYDSADSDLVDDLQIPLLSASVSYLRGVGFFTSGWMRLAARGLQELVENGGHARIIVSPILEQRDWEALQAGDSATRNQALYRTLEVSTGEIAHHLEHDTLNTLAWMVADGLLEFKFAIDRNRGIGDYHDKVAVFDDTAGSSVAIHGSFNDSIKATMNGEAFSVFRSWVAGQLPFVERHKQRLEQLWSGGNSQFEVFDIPDAIREQIVRLRTSVEAPYRAVRQEEQQQPDTRGTGLPVKLRDYQDKAIANWREAGYRGIFEMATGTGKTLTALSAAAMAVRERGVQTVVVLVPYLHLMEQWAQEARQFAFRPICCSGDNQVYPRRLRSAIMDSTAPGTGPACIIAVHNTASTERFKTALSRADGSRMLLIGDEAHGLGSRHNRNALHDGAALRLGLSATPDRWFDDEGTAFLKTYFGGVCYELPIEQAIGEMLTPYAYYPEVIELYPDERAAYILLSKQIAVKIATGANRSDDQLKRLLLRRSRIIAAASGKMKGLTDRLGEMIDLADGNVRLLAGILVYAPAGHHKDYMLRLAKLGLRCREFVHTVPMRERQAILQQFASGDIQVLVAVRCLDEGVDVPSTKTAFILSSSTNPREFVQRRGRILRKAPNKVRAEVYDFLVLPSDNDSASIEEADRGLLRREMPRFAEFASAAINEFAARAVIRPILDRFEMLTLLDKRPWEVYKELRQSEWENEDA